MTAASATVAAPATAKGGSAGSLDPSFGKGGKATVAFPAEDAGNVGVKYSLPFQFTSGHLAMAPAPGGKIVVAGSTRIARFLANGKLDPQFGIGGVVSVARPAGLSFVLAAVAVDSQGRVLIGGSARPLPADSTPDPLASSVMIERFAANGSVDSGFANQGTLISDLGIEAPVIGQSRYPAAAVGIRSLVVDSEDRPVLTGGSVSEVTSKCTSTENAVSTAFVARLTEAGALDPSFGSGGLREIADFGSFEQGNLLPNGKLLAIGTQKFHCSGREAGPAVVLTSFGTEGNLDPGFGFAGFRSVGYSQAPVATVTSAGKIVLLGAKRKESQLVMRLLADGGLDPSFGRIGRVQLVTPKGTSIAAVALDEHGRLLFAGRTSKRVSRKSGLTRSTFLLARMNQKGSIDRSFGRQGSVRTGFGGPSSSSATQVLLDAKGRILVGGNLSSPRLSTGGGFALARYLGGGR